MFSRPDKGVGSGMHPFVIGNWYPLWLTGAVGHRPSWKLYFIVLHHANSPLPLSPLLAVEVEGCPADPDGGPTGPPTVGAIGTAPQKRGHSHSPGCLLTVGKPSCYAWLLTTSFLLCRCVEFVS